MALHPDSPRAMKMTRARRGFFIHLAAYVAVNVLLVGVNLATTPDRLWFPWPLAGWGLGVLAHGVAVYLFAGHRE